MSADSSRATRLPEMEVSGIARHVVDDVQNAEPPATGELVMHEVERPARIWPWLDKDWRPPSDRAAAGSALSHHQPFLAVEAVDAVLAGPLALLPQQNKEPPVAEAPAFVGEVAQSGA